jgi:hypothetical protein
MGTLLGIAAVIAALAKLVLAPRPLILSLSNGCSRVGCRHQALELAEERAPLSKVCFYTGKTLTR